jgi:hypothetical protein
MLCCPVQRGRPVSFLLRLTALLSLIWAIVLFGRKELLVGVVGQSSLGRVLANAVGIANLGLAYLFWTAAWAPAAHCGVIFGAIAVLGLKVASDLYGLLVLLPPRLAVVSLADLVVSLALLVGLLEALPRVLGGGRRKGGVGD